MIPEIGLFCLIIALCMSILLVYVPFSKQSSVLSLFLPAVCGQFFFTLLSFSTLIFSFLNDDFSVEYVASNSNSHLPLAYKFCALWGAHEGSLLLWALILSLWTIAVAFYAKKNLMITVIIGVLSAIHIGFLILLLHTSNPFLRLLPFSPAQGADLNPLLQDPAFVLHPPFLYMGYVGFAVPFAIALSALIKKNKIIWVTYARPWALLAWSFLTIGILLGSWWAYYELGWGGWWFWDPVENASLMPWLMGAALTHALMMSAKRKQFAPWCILLALCTFSLTLLGTFLVRSGIVTSVHSFASDPKRGAFILGFLAIVIISSFLLYMVRISQLQTQKTVSFFSKESFVFLATILFLIATATVLLGTLYPLIIEVIFKDKISVGPPYFNSVFIPIMFFLLGLMSITPYINWKEDNFNVFINKIKAVFLAWGIGGIIIVWLLIKISSIAIMGCLLAALIIIGTFFKLVEYLKKTSVTQISPQKWGMIFAHFGIGICALGVSLSSSLSIEKELKITIGEKVKIGGFELLLKEIIETQGPNYQGVKGHFAISNQKKLLCTLFPEKRFFTARSIVTTETAIKAGFFQDFYLALGDKLKDNDWSVRFYIKPFVRWIWMGGVLVAIGAFFSSIAAFRKENSE